MYCNTAFLTMSAEALVLNTLLQTCRQVRRLNSDPSVAEAALKREKQFTAQLAKLLEAEPATQPTPEVAA